jgi:hypothetical protein
MADDIRQRIIASCFSKRSPSGALEEQYIAHVKIFEDATPGNDDGGRKARFVLLACLCLQVMSDDLELLISSSAVTIKGPAVVHKSRENANGSFSIGKTWDLGELTSIEVSGVRILMAAFGVCPNRRMAL